MSKSLFRSGMIVSLMTFISRILGLVRDVVLAHLLGAGVAADVFLFAQRIPNFLRRLFAEGAFAQAFVPVLSEYSATRSHDEVRSLIDRVSGTLGLILLGVTLVGVLGSAGVVYLFGAGFAADPAKFALAEDLLKITFPFLLFVSLTAFASSVLNSFQRFAIPAITPVLLNLSLIAAAWWVAPNLDEPSYALAWAIFIGGLLQLLFQLPSLYRLKLMPRPRWGWQDSGVRRILSLMLPALFGVSVSQINLLVDTQIASFLQEGSISWLYYSDRLLEFPLGIFGIAIATVILPSLSRNHATESVEQFSGTLDWAMKLMMLIGFPASVGLIFLAEPLLISLFQYGEFSAHDSYMASRSLITYGFGLVFFMLIKVLAPGYFARQDTRTPVKIGIIAMISNIFLNLLLMGPLGHAGLALATSLSALLNAALLFWGLKTRGVYRTSQPWWPYLLRLLVANALMLAALAWLTPERAVWQQAHGWQRAGWLSWTIGGAMLSYLLALALVGLRPRHLKAPSL